MHERSDQPVRLRTLIVHAVQSGLRALQDKIAQQAAEVLPVHMMYSVLLVPFVNRSYGAQRSLCPVRQ